jgi:hypothetical protein
MQQEEKNTRDHVEVSSRSNGTGSTVTFATKLDSHQARNVLCYDLLFVQRCSTLQESFDPLASPKASPEARSLDQCSARAWSCSTARYPGFVVRVAFERWSSRQKVESQENKLARSNHVKG